MRPDPSLRWHDVVVPLKPLAVAKSRLSPLGSPARRALARAFAADTVAAALACRVVRSVTVVTADQRLGEEAQALGARVVDDPAPGDLNRAVRLVAAGLPLRGTGAAVVALCGDLPALRPEELQRALGLVPDAGRGFVPDASGTGTTAYVAARAAFRPAFGPGSAHQHRRAGARCLALDRTSGLRRDVDTPEDLAEALGLGVGRATRQAVHRLGLTDPGHATGSAPTGTDPT